MRATNGGKIKAAKHNSGQLIEKNGNGLGIFTLLPNVRDHRWLPVAGSVPGAKRPSTEHDAGRHSVDRIVGIL